MCINIEKYNLVYYLVRMEDYKCLEIDCVFHCVQLEHWEDLQKSIYGRIEKNDFMTSVNSI